MQVRRRAIVALVIGLAVAAVTLTVTGIWLWTAGFTIGS
jgi:hypothetical protein